MTYVAPSLITDGWLTAVASKPLASPASSAVFGGFVHPLATGCLVPASSVVVE
jgi:hypothetical protein